eukprot:Blabericola_migrator_1__4007@NODE_2217_length_3108_cov_228_003288_g1396_i0_p3_GENE_NODE_2217_length_3108_cov_228_003288_g1396_i0NODE_2217_length_3108_cov_228_003288_g1396_i0_p3_ORF_typecomplete_len172_score8_81_NODE_2217_length_3108_cov_228_003288_g1396_i073516
MAVPPNSHDPRWLEFDEFMKSGTYARDRSLYLELYAWHKDVRQLLSPAAATDELIRLLRGHRHALWDREFQRERERYRYDPYPPGRYDYTPAEFRSPTPPTRSMSRATTPYGNYATYQSKHPDPRDGGRAPAVTPRPTSVSRATARP